MVGQALLPGLRQGAHIMGMPAVPHSVTTLEEFFALPEDNSRRHELLDGVYVVSPPPSFRHQDAVMELFQRLLPAIADRPDLVLFPVLGDIVLGPRSVAQPDLFVIPRPPSQGTAWRDMARPLLVVEILSPSTAGRDRLIKRRLYQEAGIPEYWIVDLDSGLVERWRPGDERPEILDETLTWQLSDSAAPFELDLAAFFAEILDR
jgi:Uma2 family endonuclease